MKNNKGRLKSVLGRWNRNQIIEDEISSLRLNLCKNPKSLFPPYGVLGNFEFHRGPDFWAVKGKVPLITAERLYNESLGKAHILVASNEQRPSPSEKHRTNFIRDGKLLAGKGRYVWAELDPCLGWVITNYKIISFPAVQLFIDILKEDKVIR